MAKFDKTSSFKQEAYFERVFKHGLTFSQKSVKLNQILAIDTTNDGQSHFASMADIVVGSFRYVVNEPDKDIVGSELWKKLARIMWGKKTERATFNCYDRGFCFRPKQVLFEEYRADQQALIERLNRYWR